jgi:predicted nucleotidyltransferase
MSELELPDDFRDVLVALADEGAEFVLIGGWAMAVHGRPRATEDLDVLVRASPDNSARVVAALATFGAPLGPHGVDATTFEREGPAYRIGVKPLRIEVLTKISGTSFEEAVREPMHANIDGRDVLVIGREALLRNKRAAGRHKDLDDVEWLETARPAPER